MKVGSKVLGLAVGQKSILVAEVALKGEQHVVTHCGEFVFPEGLSLSTPEKLGQAFRDFLRGKAFSTKEAVIGLAAKRLITRRKEIPAASSSVAASTLRLQAEGEFSSELDNLVMDFAGTPSSSEPSTVLLIATKKVLVDECTLMAEAAGLRVHAVTSTTIALGRATSRIPGGDGMVLDLGPNGAELVIQHGTDPAHLRHMNVPTGTDPIGLLAGEIRRTMASIPRNGTPQTLALWNTGTSENPQSILEQRLAMPVTTPGLETLVTTEGPDARAYVPAIAVALSAMEDSAMAVDFLHSRLAPPKVPAMSPKKKAAYATGIILATVIFFGYKDLNDKQSQLDSLTRINNNSKNLAAVAGYKSDIRRYDDATNWLPKAPHFIAVLSDLTKAFNAVLPVSSDRNAIWVTDLTNLDNINNWQIKGACTNQDLAGQVQRLMLDNSKRTDGTKRFDKPSLDGISKNPADNTFSFTISFIYVPAGTATAPAATKTSTAGKPTTKPAAATGRAAASAPASAPAAATQIQ